MRVARARGASLPFPLHQAPHQPRRRSSRRAPVHQFRPVHDTWFGERDGDRARYLTSLLDRPRAPRSEPAVSGRCYVL